MIRRTDDEPRDLARQLRAHAELEKSFGVDAVPRRPPSRGESKAAALAALKESFAGCRRCPLHGQREHIVFGEGSPDAELMFVGEAPGADEDRQGRPFVGRAGQLLTKIIAAIDLTREDVYIANILKCRPPNNRTPAPDEVAACNPFLFKQIEIIAPKIIVALGGVAGQTLLETDTTVGRLRGIFRDFHGCKLLVTYHPAYLLRNPSAKRDTWEDLKQVRDALQTGQFE